MPEPDSLCHTQVHLEKPQGINAFQISFAGMQSRLSGGAALVCTSGHGFDSSTACHMKASRLLILHPLCWHQVAGPMENLGEGLSLELDPPRRAPRHMWNLTMCAQTRSSVLHTSASGKNTRDQCISNFLCWYVVKAQWWS